MATDVKSKTALLANGSAAHADRNSRPSFLVPLVRKSKPAPQFTPVERVVVVTQDRIPKPALTDNLHTRLAAEIGFTRRTKKPRRAEPGSPGTAL